MHNAFFQSLFKYTTQKSTSEYYIYYNIDVDLTVDMTREKNIYTRERKRGFFYIYNGPYSQRGIIKEKQ